MKTTILLLAALIAQPKDKPKEVVDLNEKVLTFCKDRLGEKVGDGECGSLASHAVHSAKARRPPPYGEDGDYVWGDLVAVFNVKQKPVDKIKPGDILQFRDAKFALKEGIGVSPHHTAIVAGVKDDVISVLHQNAGKDPKKKQTVQTGEYDISQLQEGWVKAYRPVPLPRVETTRVKYNDPIATEFHRLVNKERADRGLDALNLHEVTGAVAQKLSKIKPESRNNDMIIESLLDVSYHVKSVSTGGVSGPLNAKSLFQAGMKSEGIKNILMKSDAKDLGLWVARNNNQCAVTIVVTKEDK
jgi:hypothetical protein